MVRNPFGFPYDLRMLAGSNIAQARVACSQLMDATAQAMSIWLNALPQNQMTSRFKAVQLCWHLADIPDSQIFGSDRSQRFEKA